MNTLKQFFKKPVVLFSIVGIVLFYIYSSIADFYDRRNREIVISSNQIQLLVQTFAQTWNRAPTESELKSQIDDYIKGEVYYREAVKLGIDKTDPAIKTRLRQVMELMLDDNTSANPTRAQLEVYLSQNEDRFKVDPIISFQHLYFSLDEKTEAEQTLSGLKNGTVLVNNLNRSMAMIPSTFEEEPARIIERTFGKDFTLEVFKFNPGEWHGPIQSAYGWHLVKISDKTEGIVPPLEDIWEQVVREWTFENQKKVKEELYEEMQKKYTIIVEE